MTTPPRPGDYLPTATPRPSHALTDGNWRFDPFRRVQVWVPNHGALEPSEDPEPQRVELPEGVACGYCGALVTQACHTRSGITVAPHKDRRIPRQCPCGTTLTLPKRRFCDDCRDVQRREGKGEYDRARYQRMKEAA